MMVQVWEMISNVEYGHRQRYGFLFGILMWIAWAVSFVILFPTRFDNELTGQIYSNQLLSWVIFGSLAFLMFIGQFLLDRRSSDPIGTRREASNMVLALVTFGIWSVFDLILMSFHIDLPFMINVAAGYALVLMTLMMNNRARSA